MPALYRLSVHGCVKLGDPRVADSSSTHAVSFSSARKTNRFPSPRCASAIQIVRPRESTSKTKPQLQPALLRLSAIISQYLAQWILPCFTRQSVTARGSFAGHQPDDAETFDKFLLKLSDAAPEMRLMQPKPNESLKLPELWVDPVTGEKLSNPFTLKDDAAQLPTPT